MLISLDIMRHTLRNALGYDSFVASFIRGTVPDGSCPTASIDGEGIMRYSPDFVQRHVTGEADLFSLILHEIMHPMFGHFVYGPGKLENLGADLVINASISQLFSNPSDNGNLFKKLYQPIGVEALLRPGSKMRGSRFTSLYGKFYGNNAKAEWLSTGEVIQTLRILIPREETGDIFLLGSHGGPASGAKEAKSIPVESLSRLAEDLRKSARSIRGLRAGSDSAIYSLLMAVLKSHISIKRKMLEGFATKQKVDAFKTIGTQQRAVQTPIPLRPSKRDLVMLAAGVTPFHYHNRIQTPTVHQRGLPIYLDVSGSVNEYLPQIIGVLNDLRQEIRNIFLFSNEVVEVPFKSLLQGEVKTTLGTDFDCIAESMLDRRLDKAVIFTDGYASITTENIAALTARRVRTLTVLFGDKTECPELAPLGDVVNLEDITTS